MRARVLVTRNGCMESVHSVAFSIVSASGQVVLDGGDTAAPVFLRSAAKPLVAAAMLADGAAERLGWSDEDVAIISGSHHGEAHHIRAVLDLLHKQDQTESALICGACAPKDPASATRLIRAGQPFTALHNNCSGQHAGILGYAAHFQSDLAYTDTRHPAHRAINSFLSELLVCDVESAPQGVDGCGLPTFAVPLRSLALAYARFANAKDDATSTARALNTVRGSMTANPKLAGGRTSLDTALMSANPALLSKSGAEAVYGIALVDLGLGIAVKILDGNPRALPPVIDALLAWAGAMDSKTSRALEPFLDPLRNAAGHPVGNVVADVPMLANGLRSSRVEPAFESPASNR